MEYLIYTHEELINSRWIPSTRIARPDGRQDRETGSSFSIDVACRRLDKAGISYRVVRDVGVTARQEWGSWG